MSKPTVTTLCGSTRFMDAHLLAMAHLSLAGRIVIPCGLYGHADSPMGAKYLTADGDPSVEEKQRLDELHLRKIDLSDGIFVVNVGGHIGDSTRKEITYAREQGKTIEYMFDQEFFGGYYHGVLQ